ADRDSASAIAHYLSRRSESPPSSIVYIFFFTDTATTEFYTLSLHDALPISLRTRAEGATALFDALSEAAQELSRRSGKKVLILRSEEHTSELQSLRHLVCRLLLEKKKHN